MNIPESSVYWDFLPHSTCWLGFPRGSRPRMASLVRETIWRLHRKKFYDWLGQMKFDTIHLNSLTLYPLIDKRFKFILHIRERFDGGSAHRKDVKEKVGAASGVIFIDQITRNLLSDLRLKNSIILPNPIDMESCLNGRTAEKSAQELKISIEGKTVFSVIGRVDFEDKGIDFIIQNFKKINNDKISLLIFGAGDRDQEEKARRLAESDSRIHFCGPVYDQGLIYSVTDIVLRAESRFSLGRTVFEGLYSGCQVLLPGQNEEIQKNAELEGFGDQVHFYTPRSDSDFAEKIKGLVGHKRQTLRNPASNLEDYLDRFYGFLDQI